jgi:CRP/FNR family transcriptional regulator, cyclic AMP receptor protein
MAPRSNVRFRLESGTVQAMRIRSQSRQCPEIPGMSASEIEAMNGRSTTVMMPAGSRLLRQGATGRQLLWVISGEADVIRSGERIGTAGPGDVLGEMTMLGLRVACSADVVATTDMEVVALTRSEWQSLRDRVPTLAANIAEIATSRQLELAS